MLKRIFNFFLITILSSIIISAIIFYSFTKNFYKEDAESYLTTITRAINSQLAENYIENYDEVANYYSNLYSDNNYKLRVTFIEKSGKVIGESDYNYDKMEDHSNRIEIVDAFENGFGISTRYSRTIKSELLYVAVLTDDNIVLRTSIPFSKLEEVYQKIINYILISALAAFLISLLIAYYLSYTITKPINRLSDVSKEIYMGNLNKRVKIDTKDELKVLADVFNNMADQLQKTINNLKYENIKINAIINSMKDGLIALDQNKNILLVNYKILEIFDLPTNEDYKDKHIIEVIRNSEINALIDDSIKDEDSYIKKINLYSDEEEKIFNVYTTAIKGNNKNNSGLLIFMQDITEKRKLELVRSEFVSNVTHELKTPLTSIRGFIETLRDGAINDIDTAEKFLEIIDIESERLYNLINDVLELSEIENSNIYLSSNTVNVNEAVFDVFTLLKDKADKKNIKCINDTNKIMIQTDKARFTQLLINLVDNAIKYNKENGSVTVKGEIVKGGFEITVKDTGIGMHKEETKRIFERFYRVDKGRDKGGTGLGLSIVKHLVLMFNGDINVTSKIGEGSSFIITIPQKNTPKELN